MTDPAPSPAAAQPPTPHRPMPRLGHGACWSTVVAEIDRDHAARTRDAEPATSPEVAEEEVPQVEAPSTSSLGEAGSSLGDRLRAPAELRELDAALATSGMIRPPSDPADDVIPFPITGCLHRHTPLTPPPAAELLAMADDLNAHGGLDETFVAALLREAADPYADAKRGLGIVDPPPPVTSTEPISYETIVEALEKVAPLGPARLDTIKLTQAQLDAFPRTRYAAPSGEPWHFFGTPVELVDTVEESTPYQLANAQPGGIIEIHGNLTEPEYERLRADWLRAVDARPRLSRWVVEPRPRVMPFGEPFRPLADVLDEQPPVLRPWWRRALDRVRRFR